MAGPDMSYGSDDLRAGATAQDGVAEAVAALTQGLLRAVVEAGHLGDVPHGAGFAAGLEDARDVRAAAARFDLDRRTEVAERVRTTAGIGDLLTSLTTDVATGGATPPGSVPPGLVGPVVVHPR